MQFDPSPDFAAVTDGTQSVALHRRGSSPGAPGIVVAHALRRAVTAREAAQSGGRYTASDVVWHLPAAEVAVAPRVGDLIADAAGSRWTILDLQLTTLAARWRCTTRELALSHGLDDTITVLKASYAKSAGGAAEPTWQPWKTGVRARIQPVATREGTQHQALHTAAQYRIFVAEDLALDHTHRIQSPDGTVYRILGTSGGERIGDLQTIEAERV